MIAHGREKDIEECSECQFQDSTQAMTVAATKEVDNPQGMERLDAVSAIYPEKCLKAGCGKNFVHGLGPRCDSGFCECACARQAHFAEILARDGAVRKMAEKTASGTNILGTAEKDITTTLHDSVTAEHLKRQQRVGKETEGCCKFCALYGTLRGSPNAPLISICEVRRHIKEGDCWIIARNNVYDVSLYMDNHPGGKRSLLRRAGGCMDCSEDLEFHSKNGKKVWERFKIGRLIECSSPPTDETCAIL